MHLHTTRVHVTDDTDARSLFVPLCSLVLHQLAETLLKLGRKQEAQDWLEKARSINSVTEEDVECDSEIELLMRQL